MSGFQTMFGQSGASREFLLYTMKALLHDLWQHHMMPEVAYRDFLEEWC